eukprot:CAMPEP_0185582982 /NCGR_PEP_ID=MMETSP0434-20130131/21247_1 /TAXON_ID=626734 ORGANISM="Favella taraikaensis, Strain Fe Narragansett Bay" /NCGR_SAMPLE_ID=MMETSP0434 /ASSEMBLY_ACC=CAM_ASM_000379 /LENGTH=34 /DNA_ID= /DNA_START= /DNA_END= /DNA_ORIENTATION=
MSKSQALTIQVASLRRVKIAMGHASSSKSPSEDP